MTDSREASLTAKLLVESGQPSAVLEYIAALEADFARLAWLAETLPRIDTSEYCTVRLLDGDGRLLAQELTLHRAIDAAMSSSPLAPTQEGA